MITSSTRSGLGILFSLALAYVGFYHFKITFFEYMIIVIGAAIVTKLTDIHEEIMELRFKK